MALDFINRLTGIGRKVFSTRQSDPPRLGTRDFLELYDTHPWVRGVLSKVGGSVGSTEWQLWDTKNESMISRDHVLYQLLRKPNPIMPGRAFFRVAQLSLDLVGSTFWLVGRNMLGSIVELWPIPVHWVAGVPTATKPTYRLSYGDLQAEVPESEAIWLNDPSPANPYVRGSGIVQALGDEVQADEFAAKHVGAQFFNRAMPEVVVMDEGAGPDEMDVLERKWKQRLQGLYRVLQPYFLNRKVEFWQPQQMNLENLTLVPLRQFERDIQLQAVGMPPEQMGIVENSNRATAEASNFIYEDRIVRPRREFLADCLTYQLAIHFDKRIEVRFKNTVPADKEHKLAVMKSRPEAFYVDEIREEAGIGPDPDPKVGQSRIIPLNSYMTADPLNLVTRPGYKPPAEPTEEPGGTQDENQNDGGDAA